MFHFLDRYFITLLLAGSLTPLQAAVVHKWVDADGITHYSDEAPPAAQEMVTRIELPASENVRSTDGYHSIARQWERMHRERLELEKIKLEQARLKAAQQPARVDSVDEETTATRTGHVALYPLYRYPRHERYRPAYKHKRHHGQRKQRFRQVNTRSDRSSLGFYKHVQ